MAWQGDTASPNSGGAVFIFSQEFVNCPVSPICFAAMRRAIALLDDLGVLFRHLARTSFFRIDKAMSSLLFVASAGRFTGYDPG